MKPSTLAYLLGPMAVLAKPCHLPKPTTSSSGSLPSSSATSVIESSSSAASSPSTSASTSTSASIEAPTTEVPTSTPTSATSAAPSTTTSSSASATPTSGLTGLDALFKAKGKLYFGTAADQGTLSIARNAALIQSDFGELSPENSMKWQSIEPSSGSFSWTGADALVDYAMQNGQSIHGHTLLWYQQLPAYVEAATSAEELTSMIESHISAVVGRYKGQIRAWDVVNEVFAEDGTLRDCVFTQLLGEDFIRIAFEAAHAADPDAKLYVNEYHLESATGAKTTGAVSYISKWIEQGIPIDGIGMQAHLGGGNPDASGVQGGMEALATTGVTEIAITELDITGGDPDEYVTTVSACLNVPICVGITTWGVSDANSWLSGDSPLLFDSSYQPKPAYDAVIDLLSS
ncbi:glycoside hydrolase family 10 protein [Xylariomycetidae sp. FL2044]|nr:glycoside hydrolase family 10 protein [Xylariomycetidae sp. FL2044]